MVGARLASAMHILLIYIAVAVKFDIEQYTNFVINS